MLKEAWNVQSSTTVATVSSRGDVSSGDHQIWCKPVAREKHKFISRTLVTTTTTSSDGTTEPLPVALLIMDNRGKSEKAQICGWQPCYTNQKPCGQDDEMGKPIYEWAVVGRRKASLQFTMKTAADGINFRTDYFGKAVIGQPGVVLKREGIVCLSMIPDKSTGDGKMNQSENCWTCKAGAGMDVVLMLCFVACFDKVKKAQKDNEAGLGVAAACG